MTVCIAALCASRKKIVAVADTKISFGDYSADDLVVKVEPLVRNWWVLLSGTDIVQIPFILSRAKELLQDETVYDEYRVPRAVHMAYVERLRLQIESQVLDRYDITLSEFSANGRADLSPELYKKLSDEISGISLGLQFMVVGFGADDIGHLVFVDGQGAPASYDSVGFCAIGSGMNAALSTLAFQADRKNLSVYLEESEAIYSCCAAKFVAESASDVGRNTFLTLLRGGEQPKFIFTRRIDHEVRKAWERYWIPRIPKSIINKIPEMIYGLEDLRSDESIRKFLGADIGPKNRSRRELLQEFEALNQLRSQYSAKTEANQSDQRSTTADPSPPLPSLD